MTPKQKIMQKKCLAFVITSVICCAGFSGVSFGKDAPASAKKGEDAHKQTDIQAHKTIAQAHLDAAKCLEAGTAEKSCHDKLQKACQGLAIGKYCGMRHSH